MVYVTSIIALCSIHVTVALTYRPVVLMHGLVSNHTKMARAQAWIEDDFPGIYVSHHTHQSPCFYLSIYRLSLLFSTKDDDIDGRLAQWRLVMVH
jgi:hypothetical protein